MINWRERIVSDPAILAGKPTIKGTRISVELILGWLANGWSSEAGGWRLSIATTATSFSGRARPATRHSLLAPGALPAGARGRANY